MALVCPVCGREAAPGDVFCEVDGTRLAEGEAPPAAPAGAVMTCACGVGRGVDGGDGYCERCGMLLRPAASRTGETVVLAPAPDVGAASRRGTAHRTDEDAVRVDRLERGGRPVHILVVCDGVSSSSHGELASTRAAEAALGVLRRAVEGSGPADWAPALREAVGEAHRAACAPGIARAPGKAAPGTTLVAAVAWAGRVDVAWVGDSRAYLLGPAPALLTHDHSWINEVVDAGELTAEEAARSPNAHALTRCLGPLEDPDPERTPEAALTSAAAPPGSRLVLCSDGVWNSAPGPDELAALIADPPPPAEAPALAAALVDRAFAAGGRDDVTAAVALI